MKAATAHETSSRESSGRRGCGDLLDPVQLGVLAGVIGLLPSAGALEGNTALAQELPQTFSADFDPADGVAFQVVGQLAQAPVRERTPEPDRARGGRRDDELLVVAGDRRGRPPACLGSSQASPPGVEIVKDIADGVLMRGDQPRDRRNRRPDADAMVIISRRTRIDSCSPRRTICCSLRPS